MLQGFKTNQQRNYQRKFKHTFSVRCVLSFSRNCAFFKGMWIIKDQKICCVAQKIDIIVLRFTLSWLDLDKDIAIS